MYVAAPPAAPARNRPPDAGRNAARFAVRVDRVAHRVFGAGSPFLPESANPWLPRYITDLSGLYGVDTEPAFLDGTRNTYAEMACRLLGDLGGTEGDPVDLVLVAYATPDADTQQSATSALCEAAPGDPLPLGVSDQGVVAPFTGMRLAGEYLRGLGSGARALFLVMDQRSLPYRTHLSDERVVARDVGVALRLTATDAAAPDPDGRGPGDQGGTLVEQYTETAPADISGILHARLPELLGGERAYRVLAGPGIDPERDLPPGPETPVIRGERGAPCTSVWAALAGLADPAGRLPATTRPVLVEYDRELRSLSICVTEGTPG